MSRRDTILIAVILNAGLLGLLFLMAIQTGDERLESRGNSDQIVAIQPEENQSQKYTYTKEVREEEVDHVLKDFAAAVAPINYAIEKTHSEKIYHKEVSPPAPAPVTQKTVAAISDNQEKYVEVTVKRGDALEKIARANGTSVDAIKKANNLSGNQIAIGQVLRVPLSTPKPQVEVKVQKKQEEVATGDAQYYTVKVGDNPWKIAKQFQVDFDDILRLNHLDEEKARNMKIGDRIRVR